MDAIISVLGPFYLYAPLSLTHDIHPQDHKMAAGSLTVASILQDNILLGQISLVGPRPIVEEELEHYGEETAKFLSVKPGLTGYWQAYARNNALYETGERQAMEMYYIDHQGFLMDLRILFRTVYAVLKKDGAE